MPMSLIWGPSFLKGERDEGKEEEAELQKASSVPAAPRGSETLGCLCVGVHVCVCVKRHRDHPTHFVKVEPRLHL